MSSFKKCVYEGVCYPPKSVRGFTGGKCFFWRVEIMGMWHVGLVTALTGLIFFFYCLGRRF